MRYRLVDLDTLDGDRMRKTFECLLILTCFCLPASAKTSDACGAAMQHLTVPEYADINDGVGQRPLQFLFSESGDDIYIATPSNTPNYGNWLTRNGIRIIVVYQNEQARQQAIANIRRSNNITGPYPALEKLKFAVVRLMPEAGFDAEGNVPATKWSIEDIQYYAPDACASFPLTFCVKNSGQMVPCVSPDLHASDVDPNFITALLIPVKPLEPYSDPQYIKLTEAIQAKLKEFIARNKAEALAQAPAKASIPPSPSGMYTAGLVDASVPCAEATQHLQVPEGIQLALPGQSDSEPLRNFLFMFSQDGVDVYAVGTGNPPTYQRSALLVFQDDKTRREYLKSFVGSGAVSWEYFETSLGRQDWKPIMNLKYATFDFSWRQSKPPQPLLTHAVFYAPLDCNSQTTFPNALPSSAIGAYTNMSPADAIDPSNTAVYRAAVELQKLDLQKSGSETAHAQMINSEDLIQDKAKLDLCIQRARRGVSLSIGNTDLVPFEIDRRYLASMRQQDPNATFFATPTALYQCGVSGVGLYAPTFASGENWFWHVIRPPSFQPAINTLAGERLAVNTCLKDVPQHADIPRFDHAGSFGAQDMGYRGMGYGPTPRDHPNPPIVSGVAVSSYDVEVDGVAYFKTNGIDLLMLDYVCLYSPMLELKAVGWRKDQPGPRVWLKSAQQAAGRK